MEGILNLENWRKFGNDWVGYYIYPIASKVAYEIVINFHYLDTPILTAKGTLSIVGLWNNKDKSASLEREYLAKDLPVQELLTIANKDMNDNINNICYYLHINKNKNIHLRIYK